MILYKLKKYNLKSLYEIYYKDYLFNINGRERKQSYHKKGYFIKSNQ